jgi:hypothetical protein
MTKTTTLSTLPDFSPAHAASPLNVDDKVLLYALGDLKSSEKQAFEADLVGNPALVEGVSRWNDLLFELEAMPLLTPSQGTMNALWARMQEMQASELATA